MFPRIIITVICAFILAAPFALGQQAKTGNAQLGKPQPPPVEALPDQTKLDPYLERWEKETKNLRTLDITCERTRTSAVLGKGEILDVCSGSIKFMKVEDRNGPVVLASMTLQKRDGKATDFERIVFSGNFVYVFQPREKTVLYYDVAPPKAGKASDDSFMPFLSGMKAADAKKRYEIKLTKENDDFIYLEVMPRQQKDKADFVRAQIVFERKTFLPKRVWYAEANRDTTTFLLTKIEKDKQVNRKEFERPELPGKDWKFKKVDRTEDQPPRIARPQK
ncbi:MAG TPA: TIGR03009 domain-containing protein [Gemmataceae bacterium]|jgi:TIGR03009 family protein|nr:TIGR03009 domain-containing protein [Gemmataceae bacterium]